MNGQGGPTDEGDEPFDWSALVPLIVNPMKVLVIEAMHYIDQPLSASELAKVFDEEFYLSRVSYYLTTLAKNGVLAKVGERKVRGAKERFYVLAPQGQADPDPA